MTCYTHLMEMTRDVRQDDWLRAVVRVGDGRGFVIETERETRFVVTAAHCLPHLPDPHPWAERTYPKLIGPLGAEPTIWTECVFVDAVSDLAVLGSPDNQRLYEEAPGYEEFVGAVAALPIGGLSYARATRTLSDGTSFLMPPQAEGEVRLLSLDGRWFSCTVQSGGNGLWLKDAVEGIAGGMSGSPVLTPDGVAIGVVSNSEGLEGREGGPSPELLAHLPGWLARQVAPPAT